MHTDASFDSKMSKSTAFSSEASTSTIGGSFGNTSDKLRSQKSFGTTVKRFDPNQDFKELFCRDPGPGAYSVISSAADSVINNFNT
jgi:hypothetical protein